MKQRRSFNVAATSGLLHPFNFQIHPKFNVISTLRLNVEMPTGISVIKTSKIKSCHIHGIYIYISPTRKKKGQPVVKQFQSFNTTKF